MVWLTIGYVPARIGCTRNKIQVAQTTHYLCVKMMSSCIFLWPISFVSSCISLSRSSILNCNQGVGSPMVRIIVFQAIDPGSTLVRCNSPNLALILVLEDVNISFFSLSHTHTILLENNQLLIVTCLLLSRPYQQYLNWPQVREFGFAESRTQFYCLEAIIRTIGLQNALVTV